MALSRQTLLKKKKKKKEESQIHVTLTRCATATKDGQTKASHSFEWKSSFQWCAKSLQLKRTDIFMLRIIFYRPAADPNISYCVL
jgi:hypothetical protein